MNDNNTLQVLVIIVILGVLAAVSLWLMHKRHVQQLQALQNDAAPHGQLAQDQLTDARTKALEWAATAEHANAMVRMYEGRTERLELFLHYDIDADAVTVAHVDPSLVGGLDKAIENWAGGLVQRGA